MRVHELIGKDIRWERTKEKGEHYHLMIDDEQVAALSWTGQWRYDKAQAQTSYGSFRFERQGFWSQRVVILEDSGEERGVYNPNWWAGGGVLELSSGDTYTWRPRGWMGSRYEWQNNDEKPLIEFAVKHGWFKMSTELGFVATGIKPENVDLLVIFGWYLIVLANKDAAATATTVVVAT
jgi:hypothetical protein